MLKFHTQQHRINGNCACGCTATKRRFPEMVPLTSSAARLTALKRDDEPAAKAPAKQGARFPGMVPPASWGGK